MGTKILYLHQSNLLPQVLRYFYTKNVVQYSLGYLSSDIGPKFCSLCIYFLAVCQDELKQILSWNQANNFYDNTKS